MYHNIKENKSFSFESTFIHDLNNFSRLHPQKTTQNRKKECV